MTDNNVKVELRKLGITFLSIALFYVAIYIVESRTHFLVNILS